MTEIKNIIVPYDFSKRCRAAVVHANALSRKFSAPVTLLHVIPYSSFEYAAFEGGSYVGAAWPSEADVLTRLQGEIKQIDVPEDVKKSWRTKVLKGEPPLRITEYVSTVESPLVVMPTHGHGAFRRFILGSVTAKCLHDLACPVLTGSHLDEQLSFDSQSYTHIGCAVDLTPHSEHTVRFAADIATAWGAKLTVIHASTWFSGVEADESLLPPTMRERLMDTSKGEVAALVRSVGCEAETHVGFGRPADFVAKAIGDLGIDLLVAGRRVDEHGHGFNSNAYELIRSSTRPVLSV